jgi:FlaA1/EpsC-like NDP-sugar epimerase
VRQRQINLIPTLIVGRGPEAALFIREMRERPALGYRVIGVVETQVNELVQAGSYEGVPVIATLQGLPEAIRDSGANEVIIADPQVSGDALFEVMIRCGRRRGAKLVQLPAAQDGDRSDRRVADDSTLSRTTVERRANTEAYV